MTTLLSKPHKSGNFIQPRHRKLLRQIPAYLILGLWSFFTMFVITWVIVSS